MNVALHRPAFQSSVRAKRGASLAVDGNSNPNAESGGSCSVTEMTPHSWWAVDLGVVVKVNKVTVKQRSLYGKSRLCFISNKM